MLYEGRVVTLEITDPITGEKTQQLLYRLRFSDGLVSKLLGFLNPEKFVEKKVLGTRAAGISKAYPPQPSCPPSVVYLFP